MTDNTHQTPRGCSFSLLHLLMLTAFVAIGVAIFFAAKKHRHLRQQQMQLQELSSRLVVVEPGKLAKAAFPKVADNYESWQVHVPEGTAYELRFGIGEISSAVIPADFHGVKLDAGSHRITLHAADRATEDYRFRVYVDGEPVIERTMGTEWMPNGWSQASSLSLPSDLERTDSDPMQLSAKHYIPMPDLKVRRFFNGSHDTLVTNPGYRLWIDRSDSSYPAMTPFLGIYPDKGFYGFGLRDGLRYVSARSKQYQWTLTRPASRTSGLVLTVEPIFYSGERVVLSDQTNTFREWRQCNDLQGTQPLKWERAPEATTYIAYLHAVMESPDADQPVVAFRWDAERPNQVGIRLPETPANKGLTRWGFRIVGGATHLWRILRIDDLHVDARGEVDEQENNSVAEVLTLDVASKVEDGYRLAWLTDEPNPLQFLGSRNGQAGLYAGLSLFKGLPLEFGAEIPATLQPSFSVLRTNQHPTQTDAVFPGGAVFEEIQIELGAITDDWIWLEAKPRLPENPVTE